MPAAEPAAALPALVEALNGARAAGEEAAGRLVDLLLTIDEAADAGQAAEALRLLQATPRVVARLDEAARRFSWYSTPHSLTMSRAAEQVRKGTAGPIAVALASTHGDGHLRQRAVERMLHAPEPYWMPFLVLRTADWVKPIREQARAGLALLLADDPDGYLPASLGVTLLARPRRRGGFAYTQALAALLVASPALRDRLLTTGSPTERRFILDVGLSQAWWPPDMLFSLAVAEPDVHIRARAAEVLCRHAVWTRQTDTLRRLAGSPRPQVRSVALTGLQRIGHDVEVAAHLVDPASLVRAIARDAARRAGIDPLDHYRNAVNAPNPAPGAIAGLADTGSHTDAALLHPLLTHAASRVRAQAVRALRVLDAVPVEHTTRLLHDPSPAVVREATTALQPYTRSVPAEVAWQLLANPHRVELRRAGYRLLRRRGLTQQLRAALLLANDPDPKLARRAVADAARLARDAASPGWRRLSLPALDATPTQIAELTDLAERAAATLGPDTTRMLHTWLAK